MVSSLEINHLNDLTNRLFINKRAKDLLVMLLIPRTFRSIRPKLSNHKNIVLQYYLPSLHRTSRIMSDLSYVILHFRYFSICLLVRSLNQFIIIIIFFRKYFKLKKSTSLFVCVAKRSNVDIPNLPWIKLNDSKSLLQSL